MDTKITYLVEALGGHQALGVERHVIANWRARGIIPGHMYLPICELAAEKGVEVDPSLFKFDRKPWTKKNVSAAAG